MDFPPTEKLDNDPSLYSGGGLKKKALPKEKSKWTSDGRWSMILVLGTLGGCQHHEKNRERGVGHLPRSIKSSRQPGPPWLWITEGQSFCPIPSHWTAAGRGANHTSNGKNGHPPCHSQGAWWWPVVGTMAWLCLDVDISSFCPKKKHKSSRQSTDTASSGPTEHPPSTSLPGLWFRWTARPPPGISKK